MNIVTYLGGKIRFEVTENNIKSILVDRGVSDTADTSTLTQEQLDLCYADILFLIWVSTPSKTASYSKSHGNYSESHGSETLQDKTDIYNMMVKIYTLYSDEKLEQLPSRGFYWVEDATETL